MANPGQPTIGLGATGDAVRRLERALRRTPNRSLTVDGVFGAASQTAVKQFQQGAGLTADGIVGDQTWVGFAACSERRAGDGGRPELHHRLNRY